ncbi:hypothetical protein [Streptomyces hygroscopicus]|uniref:hypothetical protein n=1 Tax=Streptomyces hygroscopicus TaxID=1912 RepID=UPI001FCC738F|nr:hypothetical protein [Streptomyces hygroscopicus]BDH10173.1 hypothetical protein HOK021_13520 [Streptomyces hygroscopicus]
MGASGPARQLVIAAYTITYAALLITGARIGELLGPRRTFLAGLAVTRPGVRGGAGRR